MTSVEAGDLPDGIYFDLDEDVYHAIEALGSTDLKELHLSAGDFWAGSWLDPDKPDEEDPTDAQILGKAYHVARLEPERFKCAYIREPQKEECDKESLLTSDTDIKRELKKLDQTQALKDEAIEERADRLVEAGYKGEIWHLIKRDYERERTATKPHKIGIAGKYFDDIIRDMKRIAAHKEISALLKGGQAEVSILWTDANGIRCKARVDYLTVAHWADMKTFANPNGKILEKCITDAFRYNQYYMQATHYDEAVEMIRLGVVEIQGDASDVQRALIDQIKERDVRLDCYYVFQQKGGVPNLLAFKFQFMQIDIYRDYEIKAMLEDENQQAIAKEMMSARSGLWMRGRREVQRAKEVFMLYSQTYLEGEPWHPIEAIRSLGDADFPDRWIQGEWQ